ncbi:hypothetical protein CRE_06783 [Caenorhabditis remanei]|uniref:Helitron helicase-like domain-containing protein n=1 Tax=Caenorhabditis remanei TaxID=31234 RepID=E3MNT1_CAERE|nr:hypothetical protein CRE_06783 [Caenorhabditis remanei]
MWVSILFTRRRLLLWLLMTCAVTGIGIPAIPPNKRVLTQNGGSRAPSPKKKKCTEAEKNHGKRKARVAQRFGNKTLLSSNDKMLSRAVQVVEALITKEKSQIKRQLSEQVMRPPGITNEAHQRRQLCRFRFHLQDKTDSGVSSSNLVHPTVQLFPAIFRAFIKDAPSVEHQGDDIQNCNDDEYVQLLSMSSRETGFDELKRHVFAHNTFARYCDKECEVFDDTTASRIHKALCDYVSQSNGKLSREVMDKIVKFSDCFQGLRSIRTWLSSIDRLSRALGVLGRHTNALKWLKRNNPEYANISLNPDFNFQFGRDIIFENPLCNQSNADNLIRRLSAPGGNLFEEDPIVQRTQPVNQPVSGSLTPLKQFQLRKLPYAPFTKDDPKADIWAVAQLFPRGTGGMFSAREHKLNPSQYIRSVILNKVRTLGTNMQLLAYHYALKMQKVIASCQGIQSRQKKNSEKFDITDPDVIKGLTAVFQKVAGFKGYWNVVKNRLKFYCAIHGPPTWFVTLNPNEREWTDLHRLYTELLGTPANKDNIRELIEKDPAVFSRYWQKRVKSVLKNVILAENGPLVTVEHYYIRTEYQHRGTQHVHCLFWCKERPQDLSNPEEIRKYLDRHLTCRLPEDSESELRHLVQTCQMHFPQHSATCKRLKKYRGKLYTTCRFHFPQTVRSKTAVHINEDIGDGKAGKMYELARGPNKTMVNDYNPALLLAWRGNVDVQFVGANKDVINYITAYATKGEIAKKAEAIDKEGRKLNRSAAIHASGIDELNSREVGALEMIDNLLGHAWFMFDQAGIWIPTNYWENRPRMVDPKSKDPNHSFLPNFLDYYYPNRSSELENFSVYNIAVNYKVGRGRMRVAELLPEDVSQMASRVISCTGNSEVIENAARYHLEQSKKDPYMPDKFKNSEVGRFDQLPDEIIWVTRVTVMYTDNRRRMKSRTQFPLEPAAAVTIHKAQGLTLDNIIMKTSSIFANSQMYVGASRVKTMTALHLIDFDATKILVDQAALAKYEKLRASTFP